MPSINDVAKQAGVSNATVSRTFNEPHLIHPDTQKRVREAAQRLNYQPRRVRIEASRGNSGRRLSGAVGFQFFAADPADMLLSNTFYAPVLAGALTEAAALGIHLLVHTTDRKALVQELPRMVAERAVDGLLLVGTADTAVLKMFAHHIRDIVLVDHRDEERAYECVLSDGIDGTMQATRSLLNRGHRRIGFFGAEPGVLTFQDRLRGYYCAHLEKGIMVDPSLIHSNASEMESENWLARLLARRDRPTAVVAANDHYASVAMGVCRREGLVIPEDLSIIGFDDVAFARQVDPPLSTVRVDKELMGRLALRRLYSRLNRESSDMEPLQPISNVVPVDLILRDSCRAIDQDAS